MDILKNFDQSLAQLRDGLPRIWWAIYQGSLQAGFTVEQSFALVTTYILGQNPCGIRPSNERGQQEGGE